MASRKIGISYITILKWAKKEIKNVPKPRRLLIEEEHSAEQYLEYQNNAVQSHEAESEVPVGEKYSLIQNLFRTDTKARIEPFEAPELNVDVFFGADAED